MSLEEFQTTHNNDFNRNGEGQLVAVACAQLLHRNQNCAADQSKHQRRYVGVRKATYDISKSLWQTIYHHIITASHAAKLLSQYEKSLT